MNLFIKSLLMVTSLLLFSACATTQTSEEPAVSTFLQEKVHKVDDQMLIGSQPKPVDMTALKAAGIKHVVSFRTPEEMQKLEFDQAAMLNELGIQYSNIPMGGDDYPYTRIQLTALSKILTGDREKILLHCGSGYRASAVAVAWLIENQGMPIEEALKHAQGWWPSPLEKVMEQEFTLVPK